ncbi:hypothetical protein ACXVUM_16020 [Williamsia sp. SKLECPSW1]
MYVRANAVPKDDETGRYLFTAAQVKKHLKAYPERASHRAEARTDTARARTAQTPHPDDTCIPVDPEQAARQELLATHAPEDITDEMVEEMMRLQS